MPGRERLSIGQTPMSNPAKKVVLRSQLKILADYHQSYQSALPTSLILVTRADCLSRLNTVIRYVRK